MLNASDKEFAAGQKEYDLMSPEARKKALADIKSGKMSEVESPFWVRGFAKNLLASEAYKFGESLAIEYEKKKNEVTSTRAYCVLRMKGDFLIWP